MKKKKNKVENEKKEGKKEKEIKSEKKRVKAKIENRQNRKIYLRNEYNKSLNCSF